MTETIRVIWVATPFKSVLYESVAKHFPPNMELKVVSRFLAMMEIFRFSGGSGDTGMDFGSCPMEIFFGKCEIFSLT